MPGFEHSALAWRLGLLGVGVAALGLGAVIGLPGVREHRLAGRGSADRSATSPQLQARSPTDDAALTAHPLFEPSRRPWLPAIVRPPGLPVQAGIPPAPRCALVGLVASAGVRLALLRDDAGRIRVAREGDRFAGWTIDAIDADGVLFGAAKARLRLAMAKQSR